MQIPRYKEKIDRYRASKSDRNISKISKIVKIRYLCYAVNLRSLKKIF